MQSESGTSRMRESANQVIDSLARRADEQHLSRRGEGSDEFSRGCDPFCRRRRLQYSKHASWQRNATGRAESNGTSVPRVAFSAVGLRGCSLGDSRAHAQPRQGERLYLPRTRFLTRPVRWYKGCLHPCNAQADLNPHGRRVPQNGPLKGHRTLVAYHHAGREGSARGFALI